VDYLSHRWNEVDLYHSWSIVTKQKKRNEAAIRLENASWRLWIKKRFNLKTISPEDVFWQKDEDITWLYGPLIHYDNEKEGYSKNCEIELKSIIDKKPNLKREISLLDDFKQFSLQRDLRPVGKKNKRSMSSSYTGFILMNRKMIDRENNHSKNAKVTWGNVLTEQDSNIEELFVDKELSAVDLAIENAFMNMVKNDSVSSLANSDSSADSFSSAFTKGLDNVLEKTKIAPMLESLAGQDYNSLDNWIRKYTKGLASGLAAWVIGKNDRKTSISPQDEK